jgi:hypothetical protein
MKKFFSILCVSFIVAACHSQKDVTDNNSLTKAQIKNGWELLFDGKTTKGWHKFGGAPIGAAWKVGDGTLYLDTAVKKDWQIKNGGDISSEEEFENFDLKLEWKISPKGNSGIMFYVHEDSSKYKYCWETGPEMQILDNIAAPDNKRENHLAGALYDLIGTADNSNPKPVGEWNQAEIICVNGKLDLYLNGVNIVSTTLWNDSWKKMVANSKFKSMPDFCTYKKGHISLQDHGNAVWFRNIMIRRL